MKRTGAILLLSFTTSLALAQSSVSYQAKKDSLSEIELQRWSHLDLLKDSIPGMSVDKAYNELLKDKKGRSIRIRIETRLILIYAKFENINKSINRKRFFDAYRFKLSKTIWLKNSIHLNPYISYTRDIQDRLDHPNISQFNYQLNFGLSIKLYK